MKTLLNVTLFALALSFGAVAVAQDYEPAPPAMNEPAPVSDKELEKFVDAQGEIDTIREDFSARLNEAQDSETAQNLQSEANVEMTQAVVDAGLDVDAFNRIAVAIQENPELQARVAAMIE